MKIKIGGFGLLAIIILVYATLSGVITWGEALWYGFLIFFVAPLVIFFMVIIFFIIISGFCIIVGMINDF
jgi:hypothetical protein